MKYYCGNCGSRVNKNVRFCPNCGAELGEGQYEERESRGRALFSIISLIIVCALAFAGYRFYQNYQKSTQEKVYNAALVDAFNSMITVATECENIGNQIGNVWYNWANRIEDGETDKYTHRDSNEDLWYDDINDVIEDLFTEYDFSKQIENAEKDNNKLRDLVTKLNNPPEKYAEAYTQFRKTYNIYLDFYRTTTSPVGTYEDYNDKFTELDEDLVKQIDILYTYID